MHRPSPLATLDRFDGDQKRDDGFTLVELLIVIVVLGVLAAVVVFALGGVTGQSAISACNADAKSVETSVSAYMANNNNTAPTSAQLTSGATPYLRTFPNNPQYYVVTLSGSAVMVALTSSDPGAYASPSTGPSTTAVNYDSFAFLTTAPNSLSGLNICAGA